MSGGKWASGARGLKGRGRAEVARERTVVGASTAGEHGREVRDAEGADEWVPRGIESARAEINGTDRSAPQSSERGRESARVGTDRRDPPVRHRERVGLGLMGRLGLNWLFYFLGNF
jgi:hypothetical protein